MPGYDGSAQALAAIGLIAQQKPEVSCVARDGTPPMSGPPADPDALARRVAELEARVASLEQTLKDTLAELSRILANDLSLV